VLLCENSSEVKIYTITAGTSSIHYTGQSVNAGFRAFQDLKLYSLVEYLHTVYGGVTILSDSLSIAANGFLVHHSEWCI
jgi:hypothetical protein